jgi:hypothetical protein
VPQPDWTVSTIDEQGRTVWFLRFQATGLYPRRIGPFQTKHGALVCLDKMLEEIVKTPITRLTSMNAVTAYALTVSAASWKTNSGRPT